MRELIVAESAGFCFGVQRSVELAEGLIREKGSCASLGQLIHNEDVVRALEAKGMRVVNTPEELRPGEAVLIRAHGAAPAVYAALEKAGAQVTDATCPKVKAIHTIVSRAAREGRFVLIIGMRRHPEVEAICGWCKEHRVLENPAETSLFLEENPDLLEKPITVVVQTTQTRSNFTECCEILKKDVQMRKSMIQYALLRLRGRKRRRKLPLRATRWSSSAAGTAQTASISPKSAASTAPMSSSSKVRRSWSWTGSGALIPSG